MLYDGCPKSLKAGVWWPQTKFGFSAVVLCPKGSLGESGVPWGWENLAVVQELPQPQQGHPKLSQSHLAGLEGWEVENGEGSTKLRASRGGWCRAGSPCRVGAVTQPPSPASLCHLSVSARMGLGLTLQLGTRSTWCCTAGPLLSAVRGAGHGVPLGECLGWKSQPCLEKADVGDGRGASRVCGTAGQRETQGTIQTLSFSSRSPREEAGSAPNCCRFSPRFSRHPCSGLRGAGKVAPTSLLPRCKGCTTWFSFPAPCLAPCTPLRFSCCFWSCRVSPQCFAWPHRSYAPLPCSQRTNSTELPAAACSPCYPLSCSMGSGWHGRLLCSAPWLGHVLAVLAGTCLLRLEGEGAAVGWKKEGDASCERARAELMHKLSTRSRYLAGRQGAGTPGSDPAQVYS